jgi:hypothetical protein
VYNENCFSQVASFRLRKTNFSFIFVPMAHQEEEEAEQKRYKQLYDALTTVDASRAFLRANADMRLAIAHAEQVLREDAILQDRMRDQRDAAGLAMRQRAQRQIALQTRPGGCRACIEELRTDSIMASQKYHGGAGCRLDLVARARERRRERSRSPEPARLVLEQEEEDESEPDSPVAPPMSPIVPEAVPLVIPATPESQSQASVRTVPQSPSPMKPPRSSLRILFDSPGSSQQSQRAAAARRPPACSECELPAVRRLQQPDGTRVYFCDAHEPSQKMTSQFTVCCDDPDLKSYCGTGWTCMNCGALGE